MTNLADQLLIPKYAGGRDVASDSRRLQAVADGLTPRDVRRHIGPARQRPGSAPSGLTFR